MYKNKSFFLILICFLSLCFKIDVKADICNNSYKNPESDYCQGKTYVYGEGPDWTNSSIGHVYQVNSNTYSNNTEYGFCIDPGLSSPPSVGTSAVEYKYFRGLNLAESWDQDFYKAYKLYVESYKASNKNQLLELTDIILRTLVYKHNVNINSSANLTNGWYNEVFKYMIGEKSFIPTSKSASSYNLYWGTESHHTKIKEFYDNFLDKGDWWENPLTITPTTTFDTNEGENGVYTFNFEIKFTNETSKYFDSNDSNLKNGDIDIGYGNAYFDYKIQINDGEFDLDGNSINRSGDGYIDYTKNDPNKTLNIFLKMDKATYDSIKEQKGKVNVQLSYETYHPMSSDNVILNYMNDRTTNETASHQRMILFSKIPKIEIINSSGEPSIEECKQENDIFKYGTNNISIEEYEEKCGCSKINYNNLNNENKEKYNNILCPASIAEGTFSESATSHLKECSSNETDYKIEYIKEYTLDNNKYCKTTCTEDISVNNLVSKNYYINNPLIAGKHYILPGMEKDSSNKLSVTGTKTCKVNISYDSWYTEYLKLLEDVKNTYNYYKQYTNCSFYFSTLCACPCSGEGCCGASEITYKCSYNKAYIEDKSSEPNILKSETTLSYNYPSYCSGSPTQDANARKPAYDLAVTKLKDHIDKLENCYAKMENELGNNSTTPQEFYEFNSDLEYHYKQTYGNKEIGNAWNSERKDKVEDINKTDEKLTKYHNNYEQEANLTSAGVLLSQSNDKASYFPNKSSNYATDINETKNIKDEGKSKTNYERFVTYEFYYRPSVKKYVDAFTGKISDEDGKNAFISNPVKLGYYFDLDASAIAQSNNDNKYYFSKLGDKGRISELLTDEELTRRCKYNISNELVKCDDGANCKLNVVYRSVDPSNIDPNKRLKNNLGFSNWKTTEAKVVKAKIEKDAEEYKTYSPENLEYSFTLDSATIAAIRDYNKEKENKYDDISFECTNGNKCESNFITTAKNGNFKDKDNKDVESFAKIINGRSKWKEIKETATGSNKYTIDGDITNIIELK